MKRQAAAGGSSWLGRHGKSGDVAFAGREGSYWAMQERIQLSNRGQEGEGSMCFQVPPYCVPGPTGRFSLSLIRLPETLPV